MQTNSLRFVQITLIGIMAALSLGPITRAETQLHQSSRGALSVDRMKTCNLGITLYMNDNDDYFPFSNRGSVNGAGWGFGRPDYVWYELVEPYIGGFTATISPFDPLPLEARHLDPVTGTPLEPSSPNYWYAVASRSNVGINFSFLSPWVSRTVPGGTYIGSKPTNYWAMAQPSKTLTLINSIWNRDSVTGLPIGGGNWIVDAPCVKGGDGKYLAPLTTFGVPNETWYSYGGWQPGQKKWREFGAAWPLYENQKFQYMMFDGSVRLTDVNTLTAGCDVKANHMGLAADGDAYLWDLR